MTATQPKNVVVVWDRIVRTAADAKLKLRGQRTEYGLRARSQDLMGTDIQLRLHWDVMPLSGQLQQTSKGSSAMVTLPTEYLCVFSVIVVTALHADVAVCYPPLHVYGSGANAVEAGTDASSQLSHHQQQDQYLFSQHDSHTLSVFRSNILRAREREGERGFVRAITQKLTRTRSHTARLTLDARTA